MLRRLVGGGDTALRDTARLEAFSDGVIAVAITLLVLELDVPHTEEATTNREVWQSLYDIWPSYVGYLISFITIGVIWANHHNIFRHIDQVDHNFIMLNLLLLLGISFLPFSSAVLAEHLGHGGEKAAVIFYSGAFLFIAVTFNLLWRQALSREGHLLKQPVDQAAIDTINHRFNLGPPAYILAFGLAFFWPLGSLLVLIALVVLYVIPQN